MQLHDLIKTNMRVISADGYAIGFVQRITETEIITSFPHRHIPIASIREVTDKVYIALRNQDMQDGPSPAEKGENL
jgi:hypothetical protein